MGYNKWYQDLLYKLVIKLSQVYLAVMSSTAVKSADEKVVIDVN